MTLTDTRDDGMEPPNRYRRGPSGLREMESWEFVLAGVLASPARKPTLAAVGRPSSSTRHARRRHGSGVVSSETLQVEVVAPEGAGVAQRFAEYRTSALPMLSKSLISLAIKTWT